MNPKPFFTLLLSVAMLPLTSGCSNMLHVNWTEEVQLLDGRVIVVERSDEYRRVMDVGAGFQRGLLYQKGTIKAELPAPISQTVYWEGSLKPLVLDVFPGSTVFFVGAVAARAGRDEWRVPDNERYVVFRLSEDGWQRIPLMELPDAAKPNLLASTRQFIESGPALFGRRVDLKRKKELDSDPSLSKALKTIIRPSNTGSSK